jgi:hypothetical protein|tara:strand:- start:6614 stop:7243 length:630 start_codon:yes stop_codon:yes gene_type:complete
MLKTTTQEFREIFLLEFTKQLIKTTAPEEIIEIETILDEEEKEKKKEIKEHVKEKLEEPSTKKLITPRTKSIKQRARKFKPLLSSLRIPENRFPQRLQYLRPIPQNIELDLGKLNQLIRDPQVQSIECNGENKRIIVRIPKAKKTEITLNEEEINEIVKEFSSKSRIPIQLGIYKVAAGRLILLSAISEVIGTKFIIRKIPQQQGLIPR